MRKTATVVVPPGIGDDRDVGKTFLITEMPAVQALRWANRSIVALAPRLSREVSPAAAAEATENPSAIRMSEIFHILNGVSLPEMEPLLDELMSSCVQIVTDPRLPPRAVGLGGAEDIEEPETITYLQLEAIKLHTGFTLAAFVLSLMGAVSTMMASVSSADIPTSPSTSPS